MTPIAGRVPTRIALFNGLGSVAYGIKDNGFSTFLLIFYNQVLGMDARLVSFALLIALVFDGLIDPVFGHLSDRTYTRWGRRLPWLYIAPFPLALAWIFLWSPIGPPSFGYLLVTAICVRAAVGACEVPSSALVAEITRDYDERTRILRFRYLFAWGGGLLMLLLAYGVFLPNSMLAREGYRDFGIAGAILMLVSVVSSALGQHSTIAHYPAKIPAKTTLRGSASEIFSCFRQPAFVVILFAIVAQVTSTGITFSISNYLYLFVWQFSPGAFRLYPFLLFASVIGSFFLAGPLHKRWGKRDTGIITALVGTVFWIAPLLLRHFGIWPADGSNAATGSLFFFAFCSNMASVISSISIWSMVADVVEVSEQQTGRREEGTFAAGAFFASKCSTGLGIFVTGFLLSFAGMPQGTKPGMVDAAVVDRLALSYAGIVTILGIAVALILRRFPITRADHEARLAALDAAARADPDARGMHP